MGTIVARMALVFTRFVSMIGTEVQRSCVCASSTREKPDPGNKYGISFNVFVSIDKPRTHKQSQGKAKTTHDLALGGPH